ncbi:D-2-hydroxyglutarate dehydrogenase YdiJ [Testudinibacter sp. TR-2022]|uniref:D-2-hydroxyglutarate dehydrogenase YdiJ n=1 Tax=Testudinibacter sp. TR-2022 TaxID=2585029 RepID=UPI001119181B|nr:FAD-binding and (Fe-S)-binding domain-containing protein [Testudinibacter sp. TR-2022]TNH08009.1 FAD-binding oxidoreductase [Pasteurellaceae bacterium Phil11]TNH25954.1 FAD-binding oxidoreductase [Testudinibacter sp. TR-2022]TNH27431.1 FAD-binding oxidoreductase [Testudinibacter sp. TR-2022]
MIPRLKTVPRLNDCTANYLTALRQQNFEGDIESSYSARLSLSTDNSVYQQLPQAILFPKTVADIVRLTKLAQREEFSALTFTPRGGGTGTNGQALNNNIIVDLSRHMNQILEFNPEQRWVRVQSGVVKDQLNQYLQPFGLFFAPELSTSNRATIGGMINTDASGQGSLQYGKTSDHILALKSVLVDGQILETDSFASTALEQDNLPLPKPARQLHQQIYQRCKQNRSTILNELPQLNRFLTGYDLKNVFSDDLSRFNLSRILTGSEGSLAFICEAKLNLLPIPKYRTLINIKYNTFDAALRNAPLMLQANALSVETVDSSVLNLAKQDIIWHSVSELLSENADNPILGLNIVEFAGNLEKAVEKRVSALCQILDERIRTQQDGIIGYQICSDLPSILKIYAMRKKAVGLLGNSKGTAKPIPFVEDTCVPPQHLADYISEFRTLLDQHGLQYGMFGHVDAGVLHVRPALDLCDPQQVKLFKTISDQVVELTAKYGGLIWGEHGKGMRSGYGERFFGEKLWQELRYIKQLFDPNNRLNPGKICTPLGCETALYPITAQMRADFDRQIPLRLREEYQGALNCNGNGLCFNFDVHSTMCPSMKVSADRTFSPKGRAALVREWLRLLSEQQITPEQLDFRQAQPVKLRDFVAKIRHSWRKKQGEYDFSHEVKTAMDTCLACKACASQCPIKIDVPSFRAQFNHFYHTRYLRPLKDYVVANVEYAAPLMAKAPRFFNFFTTAKLTGYLAEKAIGMVDLPSLSSPSLQQQLVEIGYQGYSLEQLERLSAAEKAKMLLIVQDPFTSYYDAKVVADFIQLSQKLGFKPVLLPFKPNGKAQHIKGFLQRFAKTARTQAEFLSRLNKLKLPLVGVDPAIVLSYREEYPQVLQQQNDFHVLTAHEWLVQQLDSNQLDSAIATKNSENRTWYLFPHCTEASAMPNSPKQWQTIFARFGQTLISETVGCCGMAGTFGHESQHLTMSQGIYQLSWQQKLTKYDAKFCLATGYSCRSQVKRMEGWQPQHPLQALLSLLN